MALIIIVFSTAFPPICPAQPTNGSIASKPLSLKAVFPDNIMDWTPSEKRRLYNRDNLFDLVDGMAGGFFVYGFERVVVQEYVDSNQKKLVLEIWQLNTPTDAYGLFTFGRYGNPVDIGNGGSIESEYHLSFWQGRYTVHVSSYDRVDDKILWHFARSVSDAIPKGGTSPSLIDYLTQAGFKESELLFFHEEISIQNEIWLGGENILGLSHDTNGIMASHKISGQPVILLLIEYPVAGQATAAKQALQTGHEYDLIAARVHDSLLLAALGKADKTSVDILLTKILDADRK